jgi:hypothetical protein
MRRVFAMLGHFRFYLNQAPDIKEWHKISGVSKDLMDKRENKRLGSKQFRTLYTNVTKETNILYYGAESGMNVLDPNGPARSVRVPPAMTLRGEGSTIQRGEVKTTQDGDKSEVQKVDTGKKREAADRDKSSS